MDTLVFLVNHGTGLHYFTEVNARLQVKKIIAVEVNEVYLVQTLIRDTEGQLLPDPGLNWESSAERGAAIQCRVTTEDPAKSFQSYYEIILRMSGDVEINPGPQK